MLNREGWSLLAILLFFLALLGAGFAHLGRERSLGERLSAGGGAADTAAGLVAAAGGVVLLAVAPGTLYLYGLARIGLPLSLAAGEIALLCAILPRLRAAAPGALSAPELYSRDRLPRAAFAVVAAASALLLAAAGISLLARVIAGVFALHQTLALAAAALLCLVLALLCGPQARRRMDRGQAVLLAVLLSALPAVAVWTGSAGEENLVELLGGALARADTGRPLFADVLSDLCWGVGALGAVSLLVRAMAVREAYAVQHGTRIGAVLVALLTVLAAAAGLLVRGVDAGLSTPAAAETALLQGAVNTALPAPVSALLVAAMTTALLLSAAGLLRAVGDLLAWDVLAPALGQTQERPLCRAADGIAVAGAVVAFLLWLNRSDPLTGMAQAAFLLGAVLGTGLLLRALGAAPTARGAWGSLAAGTAVAVVWTAVPSLRALGMIGALPCAAAVALTQGLFRPRPHKAVAEAPQAADEPAAAPEEAQAPDEAQAASEPETKKSEGEGENGTFAL
ncbi:MAG: hypothetical protein ACOX83_06465 [Candidatus Spyradocola sp.]|jgi:Na+/proline symporter